MGLSNSNLVQDYDNNGRKTLTVTRSTLPYEQRRRFGNRLRRLHAYLGTLKPQQYDHDALVTDLPSEKAPSCGTVACAFGHAVTSGKFKDIPATAYVPRNVKPDAKGLYHENDIHYKVLKASVTAHLKANGIDREGHYPNMELAADSYFGPGAWDNIFDICAFSYCGSGGKVLKTVRQRIKTIAEKHYGVKVEA